MRSPQQQDSDAYDYAAMVDELRWRLESILKGPRDNVHLFVQAAGSNVDPQDVLSNAALVCISQV